MKLFLYLCSSSINFAQALWWISPYIQNTAVNPPFQIKITFRLKNDNKCEYVLGIDSPSLINPLEFFGVPSPRRRSSNRSGDGW